MYCGECGLCGHKRAVCPFWQGSQCCSCARIVGKLTGRSLFQLKFCGNRGLRAKAGNDDLEKQRPGQERIFLRSSSDDHLCAKSCGKEEPLMRGESDGPRLRDGQEQTRSVLFFCVQAVAGDGVWFRKKLLPIGALVPIRASHQTSGLLFRSVAMLVFLAVGRNNTLYVLAAVAPQYRTGNLMSTLVEEADHDLDDRRECYAPATTVPRAGRSMSSPLDAGM